jgi:hypothetical protein
MAGGEPLGAGSTPALAFAEWQPLLICKDNAFAGVRDARLCENHGQVGGLGLTFAARCYRPLPLHAGALCKVQTCHACALFACCSGVYNTDDSRDFTVSVDVTGLQDNRRYYYTFTCGQERRCFARLPLRLLCVGV